VAWIRALVEIVSPSGMHEAERERERSVYAFVCENARIARRRSVIHVHKETRARTRAPTYIEGRAAAVDVGRSIYHAGRSEMRGGS